MKEGGGGGFYLPVQLHSLQGLVLVQQHGSILEQQALHLWYAVLLRQGNSLIPLAQSHTALHSALHLPTLQCPRPCQPCRSMMIIGLLQVNMELVIKP